MDETELLTYVAPEHKNEVRKLFGALATRSGNDHVATHIEGFAQMLNQRGLLSDEGLKDFLTFHGLTIGEPESTGQSRYELMSLLGHGAMGEVYLGRDPGLKRTVAVKRAHAQMAYDPIALPRLRALKHIVDMAAKYNVPLTMCGELAGRTLTAMALLGIGFRSISMSPASIGPVKAMLRSLDCGRLAERMDEWLATREGSLRGNLHSFAEGDSIEL